MQPILKRAGVAVTAGLALTGLVGCSTTSSAAPTSGQTVSIQGVENLPGLDHWTSDGVGQDSIGMLWGDMLISSDHKGDYTAGLATAWKFSPDNMSVTLTLRKGVEFSDGSAFTSADVKATLERLEDPDIRNASAWSAALKSVEAPSDTSVVIDFKAAMPSFLNMASRTPVIEAAAYEADPTGYFKKPIGTGPFTVTAYNAATGTVSLDKNTKWWNWTSKNKTNVDHIKYSFAASDTSRASSLIAGDTDVAQMVSQNDVDRIKAAGATVDSFAESSHIYLGLRSGDGKSFANAKLRQALSEAIDRKSLVDDLLGGGRAATWPSTPDSVGYEKTDGYTYDVKAAKALVAESGYDGSTLKMLVPSGIFGQSDEVAQSIQSMAAKVGIKISVQSLDVATFQQYQQAGNYDLYVSSFTLANGDSFTEATNLIGLDRFATGFKDDELTSIAAEVGKTVDQDQRDALTQKEYQIVMDQFAPNLYLYEPQGNTAVAKGVTGIVNFPDGAADFRFVSKS